MIPKKNYNFAPEDSGIYYLYSKRKKLVYIGKANNLKRRLKEHYWNYYYTLKYISNGDNGYYPPNIMYAKPFEFFRFTIIKNINKLHFIELEMIKEYKPRYNNISQIFRTKYDKFIDNHKVEFLLGIFDRTI
jgi:excinuclease UvrABC nuclease subunit